MTRRISVSSGLDLGYNRHELSQRRKGGSLDAFTRAYLEAALFSSMDESDESGGQPLDRNYSISDFSAKALARAKADCKLSEAAKRFGEVNLYVHRGKIHQYGVD